ncbi:MAG: helix-turn-helix domain-containing protein [Clostridia bacterium]|nr:helix-turn-helix domain-containing protein [Clostridia bacterium]
MPDTDLYSYEVTRDNQDQIVTLHIQNGIAPRPSQHFHDSLEFLYVADGSINARLGSEQTVVPAGNLLAVSSFLPHDFPREYAELWQLIVPRSLISNLDQLMENKTFARRVLPDPDGQLLAYMKLIYEINTRGGIFAVIDETAAHAAAVSAAGNLVRLIIRISGLREEGGSSLPVMQAIRHISLHFREPIRVGELSRRLYCNRSRLSSLFHATFGMTMNEYVNSLRAAEVRRLLSENPKMILTEAAALSGFGSLRSLHRAYKQTYGHPPAGDVRME